MKTSEEAHRSPVTTYTILYVLHVSTFLEVHHQEIKKNVWGQTI